MAGESSLDDKGGQDSCVKEMSIESPRQASSSSRSSNPKILEPEANDDDLEKLDRIPSEAPYTIFDSRTKAFITFTVSMAALISPFAATLYYPSLNPLAKALHVTPSLINLSITTYMVC